MVYNGYYKVMSNIPKMGQLPSPDICQQSKPFGTAKEEHHSKSLRMKPPTPPGDMEFIWKGSLPSITHLFFSSLATGGSPADFALVRSGFLITLQETL